VGGTDGLWVAPIGLWVAPIGLWVALCELGALEGDLSQFRRAIPPKRFGT
jgi:hypothetical protein